MALTPTMTPANVTTCASVETSPGMTSCRMTFATAMAAAYTHHGGPRCPAGAVAADGGLESSAHLTCSSAKVVSRRASPAASPGDRPTAARVLDQPQPDGVAGRRLCGEASSPLPRPRNVNQTLTSLGRVSTTGVSEVRKLASRSRPYEWCSSHATFRSRLGGEVALGWGQPHEFGGAGGDRLSGRTCRSSVQPCLGPASQ
jgi:hypothetical protein